jgi:hypothetical protein
MFSKALRSYTFKARMASGYLSAVLICPHKPALVKYEHKVTSVGGPH